MSTSEQLQCRIMEESQNDRLYFRHLYLTDEKMTGLKTKLLEIAVMVCQQLPLVCKENSVSFHSKYQV